MKQLRSSGRALAILLFGIGLASIGYSASLALK